MVLQEILLITLMEETLEDDLPLLLKVDLLKANLHGEISVLLPNYLSIKLNSLQCHDLNENL